MLIRNGVSRIVLGTESEMNAHIRETYKLHDFEAKGASAVVVTDIPNGPLIISRMHDYADVDAHVIVSVNYRREN
jgi:hypothetical protein